MSALKALLPLILIALFSTALVVTLIVMGIRGILKKKGYGVLAEKNGWSYNKEPDVRNLEEVLSSSLFTINRYPNSTHTVKDVIHGTCEGLDFFFANYTYRERRTQGHGIHDEYSVFVISRKTPGPNFYFLSVPKIMKKLAGTVTEGALQDVSDPDWDWVLTTDPVALKSTIAGEETIASLKSILNSQDGVFFYNDIIVWSIKNFQSPGRLQELLRKLKALNSLL